MVEVKGVSVYKLTHNEPMINTVFSVLLCGASDFSSFFGSSGTPSDDAAGEPDTACFSASTWLSVLAACSESSAPIPASATASRRDASEGSFAGVAMMQMGDANNRFLWVATRNNQEDL